MQYNIFQNDFYESRPGIPWAYRLTALYGPFSESTVVITKAIKEAHLPEMEMKSIQVFFGGADKYVPTRYQNYGTFSLTFNEDCNLRAYKSLLGLFRRSFDNREDIAIPGPDLQTRHYKYSNLYADLTFVLEILDPKNINLQDTNVKIEQFGLGREYNDMRVVAKYEFGECYVEKIDDLDLDYSSEEIIEWGMTVAFNSIKVTYPKQRGLILDFEDTFKETEFEAYDYFEAYKKDNSLAKIAKSGQEAFDKAQEDRKGAFDPERAYKKAQAALEEEEKKAKSERERAEEGARKQADETGQLKTGDYVTTAERQKAKILLAGYIAAPLIEELRESYNYAQIRDDYGIDLVNDTEEQIREKVEEIKKEDVAAGNYKIQWNLAEELINAKNQMAAEEQEILNKAIEEAGIEMKNSGAVDMNDTESTTTFYDGERGTPEGNAKVMDQRAAKIQAAQKLIRTYEEEIAALIKKNQDIRKSKIKNKGDYMEPNTKKIRELREKMAEQEKKLDELNAQK